VEEFDQESFKIHVRKLFEDGEDQRDPSLPSTTRKYKVPAHLWERVGKFVGNSYAKRIVDKPVVGKPDDKKIDFNTDELVPTLVLRIKEKGSEYFVEFIDVIFETEGISLTEANSLFKKQPRTYGIIGYDTEFLEKEVRMLSHQFCFDLGPEKRFGVILDTDIRFNDEYFLKFLTTVILNAAGWNFLKWYVFAHFSLVEASWIDSATANSKKGRRKAKPSSSKKGSSKAKPSPPNKSRIRREDKEWLGRKMIAERPIAMVATTTDQPKTKRKAPTEKIVLEFADVMNLDQQSLKGAAANCDLQKYAILPLKYSELHWFKECAGSVYKKLDKFRERRPSEFYRYGARDAIITAAIPIILHSKVGTAADFQVRTTRYSEVHMADWFQKNFHELHDGWQRMLGQRKIVIPYKDPTKPPKVSWEPDKLQREILQDWYKGGRNEAREVGCFEHQVNYFDMTSAYPAALAALIRDFDFSMPIIRTRTRNDGAVPRIQQLMLKGPFQPHGVKVYIRFKPDCRVPMAPMSSESGIIYPLETEGQVVCWPEYWQAKQLDIIEEEFVLALYEFEPLKTRLLPDYILEMIKKRKDSKSFYKSLLNFLTGKLAQGRRKDMPFSTISCPGYAAYITSTIRAAASEIGNLNEYYAITTDGIISPVSKLVYAPGDKSINRRMEKRLEKTGFEWMKNDFTGDKTVIWKTRGYILFNSKADKKTAPAKERFKQAKMGLQGDEPMDIIAQIKAGKGVRRSAKSFAKLDDGEVFSFLEKKFNINPNFDFKYAIISDTIKERPIEIDGVELSMPCFNTRPLRNMNEHYALRRICDWKMLKKVLKQEKKTFSVADIEHLILTASLNDGRCRHMVWEFRKRMARMLGPEEATLHPELLKAWKEKRLYPIPAEYGVIKDFKLILEREVVAITDEARRAQVLNDVIKEMEADRSYDTVSTDAAAYESFLEDESYRDDRSDISDERERENAEF